MPAGTSRICFENDSSHSGPKTNQSGTQTVTVRKEIRKALFPPSLDTRSPVGSPSKSARSGRFRVEKGEEAILEAFQVR
jgi:hypothetical protein